MLVLVFTVQIDDDHYTNQVKSTIPKIDSNNTPIQNLELAEACLVDITVQQTENSWSAVLLIRRVSQQLDAEQRARLNNA